MSEKKCKVCGRPRQCLRFGAECCNACASFYIRTTEEKAEAEFDCKNYYLCLTTPNEKGLRCVKCRYLKCIEIGIDCPPFYKKETLDIFIDKEYFVFTKVLDKLFKTCVEKPERLFDFVKADNPLLLDETLEYIKKEKSEEKNDPPQNNHLLTWAALLQNNEIPLNHIDTFLYLIMYNIKLPWLPHFQQDFIQVCQKDAKTRNIKLDDQKTLTIFEKLAEFFASQFLTHYCQNM